MTYSSKRLLSISRFAAYCGTTRQTLQHYDHIGLLKPAEVGEQGYRYYEALQGYDFRLINSLRRSGCTLGEVTEILHSGDVEHMQQLLAQKEAALHQELLRIREEQMLLRRTAGTLKFLLQFTTNEPVIKQLDGDLQVLAFPFSHTTRYDEGVFYATQYEFASFCAVHGSIQPYPYCFALSKEEVLGDEKRYHSIYCLYDGPPLEGTELGHIQGGTYAIMRVQPLGMPTDRLEAYGRLLRFVRDSGYRVSGECYELPVAVPKGQRPEDRFPMLHAIRVTKEGEDGDE